VFPGEERLAHRRGQDAAAGARWRLLILLGAGAILTFALAEPPLSPGAPARSSVPAQGVLSAEWSAPEPEEPPDPPAAPAPVALPAEPMAPAYPAGVIHRGPADRRAVALTFDADMTPYMSGLAAQGRLPAADGGPVLDVLDRFDVRATLFLTGLWADMYPERVRQLAAHPRYELANHSYSHGAFLVPCYGLGLVPADRRAGEILRAGERIAALGAKPPQLFRFPGGCFGPPDQALAESLGYHVVQWDVISTDAVSRSPGPVAAAVLAGARNGSIVVMHMTGQASRYTAVALERIIPELRARGFELVTVSDLFRPSPAPLG